MRNIQQLQDGAAKEHQKADSLRNDAEKNRQRADDSADAPQVAQPFANTAQKYETKAAEHDQAAMKLEEEAKQLEAKAIDLNRQKNEISIASQAQIDRLDAEERALRGQ